MKNNHSVFLEEERPIIELPTLIKISLIFLCLCVGASLLFLPWYLVLFLFLGLCLGIAIFFDLYIGVLIFLAGAYLHPTAIFPALQPFHIARNLAFGILFIWLLHILIYKDFRVVKTPQNLFVLGLASALLFSSFRYFDYSFPLFIELVSKAVVLYFIIINVVRTRKQIMILLWILLMLGFISSSVGIYQYIHGTGLKLVGRITRILGTTQNPNILAAELVLIVPIIVTLFKNQRRKIIKSILLSFFVLIIMAIILTFSRAGMATLSLVLFFSFIRFIFGNRKRLTAIVYSFFIFLVAILIIFPFIPQEYWGRMRTITDLEEISIASRLEAWRLAFDMILEHPLLGVGFGAFKYEFFTQALMSADIKTRFVMLHAHNLYLHTGAEAGILAFSFLLIIIFYAWKQLRKARYLFREKGDMLFSGISGALEISLIGFFIMNMVSWHLDLLIFWIIIGFAVVLNKLSLQSEAVSSR